MPTAVLIDGAFFLKRYRSVFVGGSGHSAHQIAKRAFWMALKHLEQQGERRQLYRIFFYDCPPLEKKLHNPVTGKAIDLAKSSEALFRRALHDELRKLRKVALRLGHLGETGGWALKPEPTKALLSKKITIDDLTASDVAYEARQKGVDMRIGLDIASLSYKRQVDQIILVAGDSDFVPAAKLARREGVDFLLDPMWSNIHPSLHEHVDGLRSVCPRPAKGGAAAASLAVATAPVAAAPADAAVVAPTVPGGVPPTT